MTLKEDNICVLFSQKCVPSFWDDLSVGSLKFYQNKGLSIKNNNKKHSVPLENGTREEFLQIET